MALVVLLRGINVGGHRSCRPATLARQLVHLGAINFGAAGTFVIRRRVNRQQLRAEFRSRLSIHTDITICEGREVVALLTRPHFADQPERPDLVPFVSVLSRHSRLSPSTPLMIPSEREWLVKILAREGRFVFGVYQRDMKVIGYLGKLDKLFGVPVTTRTWKTITAIAGHLGGEG